MTKCVDPVAVDLLVDAGGGSSDRRRFNGSATVSFAGSGDVSVDMQRNASQLQFQVNNLLSTLV